MRIYVEAAGCTNACRHCGAGGHPPPDSHYSAAELRRIARAWGEPVWPYYEATVHSEFPEIVAPEIVGKENTAVLATNGYGLAHRDDFPDVFGRLRAFGFGGCSFTLHGLEAHHDWWAGRDGAFQDILTASRRAVQCGFGLWWNLYLDRENLEDIPALVDICAGELGGSGALGIPFHRVGARMWRYEQHRPSLRDVSERLALGVLPDAWRGPLGCALDRLTEAHWISIWEEAPDSDGFRHPLEPTTWPPQPPFEHVQLYLTRDRHVDLDPLCAERIRLGRLSDGKEAALERLTALHPPAFSDTRPDEARRRLGESDLLHCHGFSVRLKAISSARRMSPA